MSLSAMKNFLKRPLKGFSLLETSMVLIIAGVMFGAALKGKSILEQAKLRQVAYDFSHIQTAVALYANTYGDNLFVDLQSAWEKLNQVELWSSSQPPTSKLGGRFTFVTLGNKTYVKLASEDGSPFLTAQQTHALFNQLPNSSADAILILNASGQPTSLSTNNLKEDKNLYSLALRL